MVKENFAVAIVLILSSFPYLGHVDAKFGDTFYVNNRIRNLEDEIYYLESHIDNFQDHYMNQIMILNSNEDLLLKRFDYLNKILDSMEILSEVCVKKYGDQVPHYETVKNMFKKCETDTYFSKLLSTPKATIRSLKDYFTEILSNALNECENRFSNLPANLTECLVLTTATTTEITQKGMIEFQAQMENAFKDADRHIKETFDCNFNVLTEGLNFIDKILISLEQCIDGVQICPTCFKDNSKENCSAETKLIVTEAARKSKFIKNPFENIPASSCVRVNILRE